LWSIAPIASNHESSGRSPGAIIGGDG
jgi:hypothetical protein